MSNTAHTPAFTPALSPTGKAKAAFVLGALSLLLCFLAPIAMLWNLSVLCRQKKLEYANPKTKRLAGAGLVLSLLAIMLWTPALIYGYKTLHLVVCRVNISYGLWYAFQAYHSDFNTLPSQDHWCDLLTEQADISTKGFFCPASDAVEGECTYALNKHLFDVPYAQLPADMVMLFETDFGNNEGPRTASIQERLFFQTIQEQGGNWIEPIKQNKVFPCRWNQVGGPEIAVARHHGKCQVVLDNGTIQAVKFSEIQTLRWTPD